MDQTASNYVDSFRVLHPTATVFSFNRPGSASSRLDRIYIPPLLESRPRVARYLPSTSDHLAYLLRLETAGLAVLPSLASKRSASLYWKFNSSLLSDPAFLPAFRAFWRPLAASRPLPPPDAASTASQQPSQPPPGTPHPSPELQAQSAQPLPNPDPIPPQSGSHSTQSGFHSTQSGSGSGLTITSFHQQPSSHTGLPSLCPILHPPTPFQSPPRPAWPPGAAVTQSAGHPVFPSSTTASSITANTITAATSTASTSSTTTPSASSASSASAGPWGSLSSYLVGGGSQASHPRILPAVFNSCSS